MEYPKSFRIGPVKWTIKWDKELISKHILDNGESCFGYNEPGKTLVVIDPEISYERQREVLMHEIGHCAVEYVLAGNDTPKEEEYVSNAMPLILHALEDKKIRKFLFNAE